MIVVCYSNLHQGDRFICEKEPLDDKSVSHGLCTNCYQEELANIESILAHLNRKIVTLLLKGGPML
jgi:hypothetical protein